MATSVEKFRKLLAAYEDEVQRKQHKMGKRVDPRDEVQPNWASGYCTFLRAGQQVVWRPSFELIGSYEASFGWRWGWAEPDLDPRRTTRVDEVRRQGASWGIDLLTEEELPGIPEPQAWELATVAIGVARADGMVRVVDGSVQRFLALYDGPPATRSSSAMRALRESQSTLQVQAPALSRATTAEMPALGRLATPLPPPGAPALGRLPTHGMPTHGTSTHGVPTHGTSTHGMPALGRQSTTPPIASPTPIPPALGRTPTPLPALRRTPTAPAPNEPEPTAATRAELGHRLFECVPYAIQPQIGVVVLLVRAHPPVGPVGTASVDVRLLLHPNDGGEDVPLGATPGLNDALVALWMRCRDREGNGYRFLTARFDASRGIAATTVGLEY
jgi:hypothetical protein